ncbi:2Fe-2S iron-sulfur cluster protein [Pseudomonas duriflava]|uniref:2Fe-2S iron-sulfur cluster protein n=1 Tax=Pseudomonas duriflava TaxID=459528 RepID=A0A562PQX6_9PSED|nr:(2Fe-2S)-binding protein [Pseudomonas duriflava]TWI46845.1 2Fe-2S iron-sulfur cluster protein [Pseudomonas duriflava]
MPTDSLFRRVDVDGSRLITVTFDDQPLQVPSGLTVAAALLLAGVRYFRTSPVSGEARAPYCMMGVCFECLVEINGVPSRQSCLIEVADGMRIRSQQGARDLPFTASEPVVMEVQP